MVSRLRMEVYVDAAAAVQIRQQNGKRLRWHWRRTRRRGCALPFEGLPQAL